MIGARLLHKYSGEAKTFADLLYLSLTTLIGSRTLGEEYCDIVHVEKDSRSLPSITVSLILQSCFNVGLVTRYFSLEHRYFIRQEVEVLLTTSSNYCSKL